MSGSSIFTVVIIAHVFIVGLLLFAVIGITCAHAAGCMISDTRKATSCTATGINVEGRMLLSRSLLTPSQSGLLFQGEYKKCFPEKIKYEAVDETCQADFIIINTYSRRDQSA